MQKPFSHCVRDVEGQPLRGAARHHIPATEVALLCNVLIRLQDLHGEETRKTHSVQQQQQVCLAKLEGTRTILSIQTFARFPCVTDLLDTKAMKPKNASK